MEKPITRHPITEISTESKFEALGVHKLGPFIWHGPADRAASSTQTDELSPGFFFFLVLYFPGSFLN